MSETQTDGVERDENGQYVVENEGAGDVIQSIVAQTPDDLRQQIDHIETKGRAECKCSFPSSDAISALREYNDTYKNRLDLLEGVNTNDVLEIPGHKGEKFVEEHGGSNQGMAFVLNCSDGVKLPLRLQVYSIKVRDESGAEHEEHFRSFELPPAYDDVDDNVLDIREALNDSMYVDENLSDSDFDIAV